MLNIIPPIAFIALAAVVIYYGLILAIWPNDKADNLIIALFCLVIGLAGFSDFVLGS